VKKKLSLVLIALLVMTTGGACGRAGSETNEIGLIYSGGISEDKKFKGILDPGSTWNSVGWGSKVYKYRTDQRSFIAAPEGKVRDIPPVQVVTADDIRMLVEFQLYFKLNRSVPVLRRFHDNLGKKTDAWTKDGWSQMLNEYFAPQIERALEAVALKHNWRDLYASEEARIAFQNEIIPRVKANLREVVGAGADYFCGPSYEGGKSECGSFTFTVGKPEPANKAIIEAIEAEQTNAAKLQAQEIENQRTAKELEAERTLVALYGPEGALLREAIRSGKVQQIIVDGSGRLSVQAPPNR
jgi:hypothetical protein